ncbi:hypothetical protein ACTJJ0_30070 [Chitinophaga sp. 22321]|uniref:Uncharacterized protein n=1 Tax=Chitinophaga hostae TaxID=2831022 RepID=A0ABS5J836_9BACT|nr:hypothetical protein [Chitinophaga hostae]MBS0031376.1 hypothetical protein [Chitinophaga hostae]
MTNEESLMQSTGELENDPDCNININNQGPINYYYSPDPDNVQDANNGISQLTYANIWMAPPFRMTVGTVMLEVRAVLAGNGRQWQINANDTGGVSTIASVIIQGNLATASTRERRAYVLSMVKKAVQQSLDNGQEMNVNGPCK